MEKVVLVGAIALHRPRRKVIQMQLTLETQIRILHEVFGEEGFVSLPYNRKGSAQPHDCDIAFIFYPKKVGLGKGKQEKMFRAYLPNNNIENVVLLRRNHPDYEFGLGEQPHTVKLRNRADIKNFIRRPLVKLKRKQAS